MKECNCLPLPEPPSETCLVHSSLKAQANEMAVEVIKEWRLTGNALVICISTALEKLLAENESAKKETEAAIRECAERGVERDNLLAENFTRQTMDQGQVAPRARNAE